MKKTLLCVAIMMAGSAFATPYNAGDSRTFAMGGIGVSSADAGQASIMNPALLATSLRRELFSLDIDVVALSPKVGGFGAIANDFLEEDIINRGVDIFSTLETEVSGTGGLIELGDSLQTSVASLGFTGSFNANTNLTIPAEDPLTATAAFLLSLTALQSSLTDVSTDITNTNSELGVTNTTLGVISTDTLSVQTQLTSLSTTTTTDLNEVTDDLINWLESFAAKDAYVEASVLPISFALPSRNFGFGIHLSNSIQVGAALNLTPNDTTFLANAVEDSNGLLTEATTSVGDVAGTVSTNTSTTSDLVTDLTAVQTDLTALNTAVTELNAQLTIISENVAFFQLTPPSLANPAPDGDSDGISDVDEIAAAKLVVENTDPTVAGSVAKVNAAQAEITDATSGSVAVLGASVTALSELAGGLTTALDSVNTYDGPNGIIVDGTPAVSTDDLTSTVRVALAAIQEVGVSVAKEVVIQGQTVSIGLTPKLQVILIEDQSFGVEAVDTSGIGQDLTPIVKANLDIGIAKEWDFHGRVKAGATIKNIIPYTVTSPLGVEVNLRPKMRLGVSHHTDFSTVGVDLDVTNNSAFYFGIPTRELSMGGELSLWGHAALRAGARWNVSDPAETGVFTTGLGLTPFGTGLNLAFWVPFDAFSADYGQVIADISDGELSSALTTGDQLLRDFGLSVNLQVSW